MANLWANAPWASLMSHQMMGNTAFSPNLFGAGFAGGGNLWNANPWMQAWHWAQLSGGMAANPFFSGNPLFSGNPILKGNPWGSLWQRPSQIPTMDTWMAPFSGETARAWLALFEPRTAAVASPPAWIWPLSGTGALH